MPKVSKTAPTPTLEAKATQPTLAEDFPAPEPESDSEDWFVPLTETTEYVNALLYGREGSGKTTALARLANIPHPGRLLVINAEGGLKITPLRKRGIAIDKVVLWPDPARPEPVTFKNLDRIYRRVKADLVRDPQSWLGVGIDSETDIAQALLDEAQTKRVRALQDRGFTPDEHFVDIADYGVMTKMARDLLRKFRDLPCHLVVTALERRDVDKDTGKPQFGPAVTPGLQKDLLGYVDFVLMLKSADEAGPYRALTRANSRYRAKDRFDVLPRVLAEPMMDRVVAYLNGDMVADEDPFQYDLPASAKSAQDATPAPEPAGAEETPPDSPEPTE